jgi:hypothetical protein
MHTFPVAMVLEIVIFVFGTKAASLAAQGGEKKGSKQE